MHSNFKTFLILTFALHLYIFYGLITIHKLIKIEKRETKVLSKTLCVKHLHFKKHQLFFSIVCEINCKNSITKI